MPGQTYQPSSCILIGWSRRSGENLASKRRGGEIGRLLFLELWQCCSPAEVWCFPRCDWANPAQSRVNAKELYKLTASGQFADADVDAESSPRGGSRIIAFIFGFISTMGDLVYLKNMSWSAALSPSNHYSYQPDLDRDIFFYCLFIVIV